MFLSPLKSVMVDAIWPFNYECPRRGEAVEGPVDIVQTVESPWTAGIQDEFHDLLMFL